MKNNNRDDTTPEGPGTSTSARDYAAQGIPVFPCKPDKSPLTPHGFENATTDVGHVDSLWRQHPDAMIGMPTGAVSDCVVIDLDVDVDKGLDGIAAFDALCEQRKITIHTRSHRTPRGGRHLLFQSPGEKVKSKAGVLGPGIDTRGDGGYIIKPPSRNGSSAYTVECDAPIAPLPEELIALLREKGIMEEEGSGPPQEITTLPPGSSGAPLKIHTGGRGASVNLKAALNHISADYDYGTWTTVGMSLHSWDPFDIGKDLWDEWSATAPERYKDADIEKHWNSFKTDGDVKIASLFRLASAAGWKSSPLDVIRDLEPGVSNTEIVEALREVVKRLKGADELERSAAREDLIPLLKERGVKSPTKMIDAAFEVKGDDSNAGLVIEDPKPWPEAVDGAELLQEIIDNIKRFVVLPEESAIAAALWILHAHAHEAAYVSPFLAILSPEKRCGKTTMLQVVGAMVPRRLPTSNISPAAIYRSVEKWQPTLLIDEADTFLRQKDNPELRGILNSGHTCTTAFVVRCTEPSFEPMQFSTWCPKVIAMIGTLPDTIEDRSIICQLRRKIPGETVERLRMDRLEALDHICRKAWRWAQDNMEDLKNHEPEDPPELHDRAADNWRPLFAIADTIGGEWPERARRAALALKEVSDEESIRVMLLMDIRDVFKSKGTDCLASETIVNALSYMENRPWAEFSRGQVLTKSKMSFLLKPFVIQSTTVRIKDKKGKDKISKGYYLEDFKDAFTRYITPPKEGETPAPCLSRYNVTTPVNID